MIYTFRKANREDAAAVFAVTEDARAFLAAQGVDQWQNEARPTLKTAQADIADDNCYVIYAEETGQIVAVASLVFGEDKNYAQIDGKWLTDGPYGAIHRVAVHHEHRGKGLASEMFTRLIATAREQGVVSVRIDTHADNKPMQAMINRAGFTFCGIIIILADGTKRNAYELVL